MPIDEMLAALEQEGEEHCQKILSDARAQAKQKIKDREDAGLVLDKELLADVKNKLDIERSKAIRLANFNVNKAVTQKKEELMQKLFEKLNKLLESRAAVSSLPKDIFKKLSAEALNNIKGQKEIIVSVNSKDIDNAKAVFNEFGVQYKVEDNLNTIGGLKIRSTDGKVIVDNTLESRAKKAWYLLKPEITKLLFGEK